MKWLLRKISKKWAIKFLSGRIASIKAEIREREEMFSGSDKVLARLTCPTEYDEFERDTHGLRAELQVAENFLQKILSS